MTEAEGWQQQLEQERYEQTVAALNRCAEKGASHEDLVVIAKECGVDWRPQ